jgi:hypothetical protein
VVVFGTRRWRVPAWCPRDIFCLFKSFLLAASASFCLLIVDKLCVFVAGTAFDLLRPVRDDPVVSWAFCLFTRGLVISLATNSGVGFEPGSKGRSPVGDAFSSTIAAVVSGV